jgi:hypothetical protein
LVDSDIKHAIVLWQCGKPFFSFFPFCIHLPGAFRTVLSCLQLSAALLYCIVGWCGVVWHVQETVAVALVALVVVV